MTPLRKILTALLAYLLVNILLAVIASADSTKKRTGQSGKMFSQASKKRKNKKKTGGKRE